MKKVNKKKKKKKITAIKIILGWLQASVDQALTIAVWVITWSVVEPYVCDFSLPFRLLIILLLIIILQRDVTANMRVRRK